MDLSTTAGVVVTACVGYLLGSIPIANLVARRRAAIDLRTVGDRNPGYWNAKETLGRRAALPVFVGDVAKGTAAALIGLSLANPGVWGLTYVGTGAAMLGHAFPVFARFRGGRSVLTFVGGAAVFAAVPVVISTLALAAVFAVTRSFASGRSCRLRRVAVRHVGDPGAVPDGGDGGAHVVHRASIPDGPARRWCRRPSLAWQS